MAEHEDKGIKKVVGVCIDDSVHSERAFDWYLNNAYAEGHKVALIHIHVPPPLPAVPMYPGTAIVDLEWTRTVEDSVNHSRELLRKYAHKCKAHKIPYVICAESDQGSPGSAIARLASENAVVMLVMGSRGLSPLRRTFLGSVSDYLVHNCNIAITVVPPEQEPK